MTIQQLNQYRALLTLIESQRERLDELRDAADVHASRITGTPITPGYHDKIGDIVPHLVDQERELSEDIAQLEAEAEAIRAWIRCIPFHRIRAIVTARFVDGLSWSEVADKLGGKETEYSVKQACYRYIQGSA